jgi:hypothetical protein
MKNDENETWNADPESLLALEAELPILNWLKSFINEIVRADWYMEVGENMNDELRNFCDVYLSELGFSDAELAIIPDWDDAIYAARSMDMNSEAWETEEQLRAGLTQDALQVVSPEGLQILLTHLAAELTEPIREAAEEALSLTDEPSDDIIELLIGAGQQAAYGAILALAAHQANASLAGEEMDIEALQTHPVFMKYRLFAMGRWPVSITGRSFNLF